MDIQKMRIAWALTREIDQLLDEAGAYEAGCHSAVSFSHFHEDLEIDIVRAQGGDL